MYLESRSRIRNATHPSSLSIERFLACCATKSPEGLRVDAVMCSLRDHQKRVFLLKSLVLQEEWARRYVKRGAREIESVDDILETLVSMARKPEQLTLG